MPCFFTARREDRAGVGANAESPLLRPRRTPLPHACLRAAAARYDGRPDGPMKPDLTLLYSQLGLKPDCTLAELQLAYRRRISELQPDRPATGAQSADTAALLRNLIWMYTTARRFHRRHGRLPGAAPASAARGMGFARPHPAPGPPAVAARGRAQARIRLGFTFLLLLLLLGLLVLLERGP